ncbi:hypothetical protein [Chromobacterium vaccinii]|uniref:hypothetical protein n=1 Tax=Chromobacterium vaccinii TaxID=1108595 RepID=UPI003459081E
MKKKPINRQHRSSFDLAIKMVLPGLDALKSIRQGVINQEHLVHLRMMSNIASAARIHKLLSPNPDGLKFIILLIGKAFETGKAAQLDVEELERAELWLTALRDMLGRASAKSLQELLDDLILNADIKQNLERIAQAD